MAKMVLRELMDSAVFIKFKSFLTKASKIISISGLRFHFLVEERCLVGFGISGSTLSV